MLYKYLSTDRVDVLENLEIRFTQPRALNDPFEAYPLIDISSDTKAFIGQIERDAQDLWKNTSIEEKTTETYKILRDTTEDLKLYALEKTSPSSIGVGLMDRINQTLGVLSLSRTFSNLLMWSHYAENHKGFVIGFDESHEFFHQKNHYGLNTSPSNVFYTTQRSVTYINDPDYYEKLLCEKPIDWAYEEEARIFRTFTDQTKSSHPDSAGYPIFLFELPKECIKSIHIGAHANPALRERILDSAKSHKLHTDIFETKISKARYELEYHQCV